MANDFGSCVAPRGGVPGLDLSALPVVPDPLALDTAADALKASGNRYRETVADTAAGWGRLAGPFRTPELSELLAVFTPVKATAIAVNDGTSIVAAALSEFASACQTVKTYSRNLTEDAEDLSRRIQLKGDEWATVPAIIDEQHRLLSELNKIKARFAEAEQDCANKIRGVYGGSRYVSANDADARADSSNVYAVDAPTLDALAEQGKLPWGSPIERAKLHGWAGAAQGILDTVWEAGGSAYSLTWMSSIVRPSVPELGLAETPSSDDTLNGIGRTLWNVGTFISPGIWLDRAITGKQEDQDAAAAELSQALPEMVQAESWSKGEWEYALTRNSLDVGAAVASGGGTAALRAAAMMEKLAVHLAPTTAAKVFDTLATAKSAAWTNALKPALEGTARVLDKLDDGAGAVRVADGIAGYARGPLGNVADDLLHGIDRLDQAAHRPPAMGTLGRAADHHELVSQLKPAALRDAAKPGVHGVVHVPESIVPGPRTPWTKVTEGFAPNTEYRVPGRGTFTTDANGTIKEAVIHKVKDKLNPDLNNPLPDMTYRVEGLKGEFTYKTNHEALTEYAKVAGLEIGDGHRSGWIQGIVGREAMDELRRLNLLPPGVKYDGGHLIARLFDGIQERINVVGMLRELNQSSANADNFYKFEQALKAKASQIPPPTIDAEITLLRAPGIKTPEVIKVDAWVNGKWFDQAHFKNIAGRQQK
ncbi:DNA/RNA non-specific endonuclease [Paenarthrobacter sp. NPDC089989]|uniref:DNA/RNA non-specific endonuclease n=1 Tax=unclassified Paenarthrobacter TaxID=2634190 RepID=UPI00380840D8